MDVKLGVDECYSNKIITVLEIPNVNLWKKLKSFAVKKPCPKIYTFLQRGKLFLPFVRLQSIEILKLHKQLLQDLFALFDTKAK